MRKQKQSSSGGVGEQQEKWTWRRSTTRERGDKIWPIYEGDKVIAVMEYESHAKLICDAHNASLPASVPDLGSETLPPRGQQSAETGLANPVNRGAHYKRCENNPREKAFADRWEKENECNSSVNYGYGLLQDLFTKPGKFGIFWGVAEHVITEDERMVAATVIQWLGSNCGWCFLEEALKDCGYQITRNVQGSGTHASQAPSDSNRQPKEGGGTKPAATEGKAPFGVIGGIIQPCPQCGKFPEELKKEEASVLGVTEQKLANRMNRLRESCKALRDYLTSPDSMISESTVEGFDIPDRIWQPFNRALNDSLISSSSSQPQVGGENKKHFTCALEETKEGAA